MEEYAQCPSCGNGAWEIYRDRIQCPICKKEIKFGDNIKAEELVDKANRK